MKIWKRCAAALLACMILCTSANVGFAAGGLDGETNIWSASAADIVAEHYGLASNSKLAAVLSCDAIDTGAAYAAPAPHANGTEGMEDLIAVDYRNKVFYVNSCESEGYCWIPTEASLVADGEVQETFALTESVTYYNNVEYYATEAFTYDGSSYTITVTYELPLSIELEEQQRILEIPMHLGQAVKNVEKTLNGMWYHLYTFEQMVPSLQALLGLSLPAVGDAEAEPFFDSEKHAAEINAITTLYAEYMKNAEEPHLEMFLLCDDSVNSPRSGLEFALDNGGQIRDTASALYDKLVVLAESQRLNLVMNQLKSVDSEVHTALKKLYSYLDKLVGTASKDGALELLKSDDNWAILDPAVHERIFKEECDSAMMEELGAAAYHLRSITYTMPQADKPVLTATKADISCQIVTYDVTVNVNAQVTGSGVGNDSLISLPARTTTFRMAAGATQEELDAAIRANGVEETALSFWNAANETYKISAANYHRTQTAMDGALQSDLVCEIRYEPHYYTVETNFCGKLEVPFGYRMELPVCTEDGWYDYRVIFEDGSDVSYNQGTVFAVDADINVIRSTGTAKFEYRVLDYLADDPQYNMSDAAKKILYNAAINSPLVRIRIPGENISEIIPVEGGYYIEAEDLASGLGGMMWNVDAVTLYDGVNKVQDVTLAGEKASWETAAFTHAVVDHSMQVTHVRGNLVPRQLTAEEIREYANLPHVLVNEITLQQEALSGEEGVTGKTMLAQMTSHESLMSLLDSIGDLMDTTEGKNAVLRLGGSESASIKGINGENLGYGGWSSTSDEPAIYKYLKLCQSANWSVATYYQQGYDKHLAKQAKLMAECLEIVVKDPGFIEVLEIFGAEDKAKEIEDLIPELYELSDKMQGPNENLNIHHTQMSVLVADVLAAAGETRTYDEASTLYAYSSVRRNGENSGSLHVSIQKETLERTMSINYELETVDGSDRYHVMTAAEHDKLQQFIVASEASFNLSEEEKQFYTLCVSGDIPVEGDHMTRGNNALSIVYAPRTYTVTVSGDDPTVLPPLRYSETAEQFVLELPAKSTDPASKTYYEYTLTDENGQELAVISVENGSAGYYPFTRQQLLTLFPSGNYTIYRKEMKVSGVPELVIKPTLSAELIRGAEVDKKNKMLYLDAKPTGISVEEFLAQGGASAENGMLSQVSLLDPAGRAMEKDALIGTGSVVCYTIEDVFKNKIEECYTIVMMGDVNGDGLCNDADLDNIVGIYFLEKDKKGNYIEPFPLDVYATLAANMNNNKQIDSNDAWKIRSKTLYWEGDKKLNHIVYRSVL